MKILIKPAVVFATIDPQRQSIAKIEEQSKLS
jgi:hypothetical protein